MKRRFFILTALVLSLALSLTCPVLALESTDPPSGQEQASDLIDWEENERRKDKLIADFMAKYPEECAAFDPYAYFTQNYPSYWYSSPQDFMDQMGKTDEEFRQQMFWEWMEDFQIMAWDKELRGGSAHGVNVMANGQCIPFPDVRPELINDRTMVPLRFAMEYLGAQVDYDPETSTAQVSMDGLSLTHAIGTDTLTLSDGSTVKMDVPSYIKDGRTMVPVRFFAQVLGYEVLWDSDHQTAVLLDGQAVQQDIDQNFTLFNRILSAASGAELVQEGQAAEQTIHFDLDIAVFSEDHGEMSIPVELSGSVLHNRDAAQLTLSGDLSSLAGLFPYYLSGELTDEEFWQMYDARCDALAVFSLELILNFQQETIYLRCPCLPTLDPTAFEDPDAWYALPFDLTLLPLDSLFTASSAGQLALDLARKADPRTGMETPFWYWSGAMSTADKLLRYVGDDQFTQSGGSYTRVFDLDLYDTYDDDLPALLEITPSGEHSCTYSLCCDIAQPEWAVKLDLTGSSGRTDLSLFCRANSMFQFTLDISGRISGSNRQPLSEPPAGSWIRFPFGSDS